MRVLLADDQAALRSAVRLLLEHESGITIVAEAPDASTLLADAPHLRPDLVLLDWELPGLDGFSSARSVLESLYTSCPRLQVIVLSGRPEAGRLALASGATTFVSKADPPERLLDALRRAKEQDENRRHG
jgi:DNA-binding NarL/FixJ family response regulator